MASWQPSSAVNSFQVNEYFFLIGRQIGSPNSLLGLWYYWILWWLITHHLSPETLRWQNVPPTDIYGSARLLLGVYQEMLISFKFFIGPLTGDFHAWREVIIFRHFYILAVTIKVMIFIDKHISEFFSAAYLLRLTKAIWLLKRLIF